MGDTNATSPRERACELLEQAARHTDAAARTRVQLRRALHAIGLHPAKLDTVEADLVQLGERCGESERTGIALDRAPGVRRTVGVVGLDHGPGGDRPMKPLSGHPDRSREDAVHARRFETTEGLVARWRAALTGGGETEADAPAPAAAPGLSEAEREHLRLRQEQAAPSAPWDPRRPPVPTVGGQ